jgi:hypothetical protein
MTCAGVGWEPSPARSPSCIPGRRLSRFTPTSTAS